MAKHARATRVTVRLSGSGGTLEFSVGDDGAGFPAGTSHGSGLQGMSDRLAAHGGTLTVPSQPGQGTTITGPRPTSERTATAGFPRPARAELIMRVRTKGSGAANAGRTVR